MAAMHRVRLVRVCGIACLAALTLSGCFAGSQTSNSVPQGSVAASGPSPSATPLISAQMTIAGVDVDGAHVSVSGYVTGIIENGGTCAYVATEVSSGNAVTIPGSGISNVQNTSCGTSQEPIATFNKGSWTVVLHYSSPAADVTSPAIKMEIP